jgi:hypothetical protein
MEIVKAFKLESNVKFDVLEQRDVLVISEELEKYVKFIPLKEVVSEEKKIEDMKIPEGIHQL